MYEEDFMAIDIRKYGGSTLYQYDGENLRQYGGSTLYQYDGENLRKYGGSTLLQTSGRVPIPVLIACLSHMGIL
jgi:hypothetical protein